MPPKKEVSDKTAKRKAVIELVWARMHELGLKQAEVCRRAQIDRGQYSKFLKGEAWLGDRSLVSLAHTLDLPSERLLDEISDNVKIYVNAYSDVKFYDSGLFLAMLDNQPLLHLGIYFHTHPTRWKDIPEEVGKNAETPAVGFFNRKAESRKLLGLRYWSDLCIYRGYALLVRGEDFERYREWAERQPGNLPTNWELASRDSGTSLSSSPHISQIIYERIEAYIQWLQSPEGYKITCPEIVTMSEGTRNSLVETHTLLGPVSEKIKSFGIGPIADAAYALKRFCDDKHGEFFIGGLPQRLTATREYGCVELFSSDIVPSLFSMNSLVCSRGCYEKHRYILGLVESAWFDFVSDIDVSELEPIKDAFGFEQWKFSLVDYLENEDRYISEWLDNIAELAKKPVGINSDELCFTVERKVRKLHRLCKTIESIYRRYESGSSISKATGLGINLSYLFDLFINYRDRYQVFRQSPWELSGAMFGALAELTLSQPESTMRHTGAETSALMHVDQLERLAGQSLDELMRDEYADFRKSLVDNQATSDENGAKP